MNVIECYTLIRCSKCAFCLLGSVDIALVSFEIRALLIPVNGCNPVRCCQEALILTNRHIITRLGKKHKKNLGWRSRSDPSPSQMSQKCHLTFGVFEKPRTGPIRARATFYEHDDLPIWPVTWRPPKMPRLPTHRWAFCSTRTIYLAEHPSSTHLQTHLLFFLNLYSITEHLSVYINSLKSRRHLVWNFWNTNP